MHARLPDFEVLAALHRQDPEALEQFRKHLLREAVETAPPAHRPSLEQLLARIESERQTASCPMDAAIIAFRMMRDSVERLHHSWGNALHTVAELQATMLIERLRRNSGNSGLREV